MKKILGIIISGVICISLVACTNSNIEVKDNDEDKPATEEIIKEENKTSENEDATDAKPNTSNENDDGYYRDEDGSPNIKKHGSELGEKEWNKNDEPEDHPDSYYEDNEDNSDNDNSDNSDNVEEPQYTIYYCKNCKEKVTVENVGDSAPTCPNCGQSL